MSNEKDIAIYIRLLASQVRTLPMNEAVPFLKGALALAGDHPAVNDLRGTYRELASAFDQLEAMAGQMTLQLDGKDGAK